MGGAGLCRHLYACTASHSQSTVEPSARRVDEWRMLRTACDKATLEHSRLFAKQAPNEFTDWCILKSNFSGTSRYLSCITVQHIHRKGIIEQQKVKVKRSWSITIDLSKTLSSILSFLLRLFPFISPPLPCHAAASCNMGSTVGYSSRIRNKAPAKPAFGAF